MENPRNAQRPRRSTLLGKAQSSPAGETVFVIAALSTNRVAFAPRWLRPQATAVDARERRQGVARRARILSRLRRRSFPGRRARSKGVRR